MPIARCYFIWYCGSYCVVPVPARRSIYMDDLAGFQLWLAQQGRKNSTIRLSSHLLKRVLREVNSLTKGDAISFLVRLQGQGMSGAYLNSIVTTLRQYGRYKGIDDFQEIHKFKVSNKLKSTFSDQEIEDFLSLPCPTFIGRNWNTGKQFTRRTDPRGWDSFTMFWTIMAYSGMRTTEVAHLTIDTVDISRGVYILEDTKTNDPRYVPISDYVKPKLVEYIKCLHGKYLFPSRRGGTIKDCVYDNVDWWYNFHKRIKLLGINRKGLTPYSFRHSFATSILPETNLFDTMEILGHKNPKTTMRYYHRNIQTMKRALENLPLNVKSPYDKIRVLRDIIIKMRFKPEEFFTTLTTDEISVKIRI